jgi:farnesyl-diphosphate farnesyltransferase
MAAPDLLRATLRDVSRSFYLTLRALPGSIRPQIGLAYLLARATDTIADTSAVPVERRLQVLRLLGERIQGPGPDTLDVAEFVADPPRLRQGSAELTIAAHAHSPTTGERLLLSRLPEALGLLRTFPDFDQVQIRRVLATILSGQELDLQRFAASDLGHVVTLRDDGELDDYVYRVAGCVGEFWTRLCRAHVFPRAAVDDELLILTGVRLGKGLQLVNVLRDLPTDLQQGRCYIPISGLTAQNLRPEDLSDPRALGQSRKALGPYLALAKAHLEAGWSYVKMLPYNNLRLRMACAWPILIGARTLALLEDCQYLAAHAKVRVSRREVRRLVLKSLVLYPWPRSWDRLFRV